MKIAIIGAGFYGSYFSLNLKKINKNIQIDLFDKNREILSEAAMHNQSRLHLGFHYPRSPETIRQTLLGYDLFKKEFDHKDQIYTVF